ALAESVRLFAKTCEPLPARMNLAGAMALPTRKGSPALMVVFLEDNVPPLNSKKPSVLVKRSTSTSTNPALRTLVPRRTSRKLVPAAFVARNVPPSTVRRFLVEAGSKPTNTTLTAETTALLLTTSWFPGAASPTRNSTLLLHDDPKPVM